MADSAKNKVRAKLIELYTRYIKFDDKLDVYLNGDDNQYPMEIRRVISNSPTAKRSANMMSKYIAGAGVTDDGVVNSRQQLKKSGLVKQIADDIAEQYGAWIHVGYQVNENGKLRPSNPRVLDYCKCRIGKEDGEDNKGRVYVDEYSTDKKELIKKKKQKEKTWYYPFNKDQNVVIAQIKKDAEDAGKVSDKLEDLLPHYKGQVYYLNLTPKFNYAVSLFDSVYNDSDTEYRMGLYSNSEARTGFLGKLAVITQGLDEDDSDTVDEDVQNWLGAENSANVWRLNVAETDDISKILRIEQIKSQYDEKQFTETKKDARINIMGAANNIPESLVLNSSGLFGQSGEAYIQAKEFYTEQTDWERSEVERTMDLLGFPCKIIPLYIKEETKTDGGDGQETPDAATIAAQAALRGSVGGVQGILQIQASVSAETTDFESAIAILVEIYGFTRTVSAKLLGRPEIKTEE